MRNVDQTAWGWFKAALEATGRRPHQWHQRVYVSLGTDNESNQHVFWVDSTVVPDGQLIVVTSKRDARDLELVPSLYYPEHPSNDDLTEDMQDVAISSGGNYQKLYVRVETPKRHRCNQYVPQRNDSW